jgi:hypothetical protein
MIFSRIQLNGVCKRGKTGEDNVHNKAEISSTTHVLDFVHFWNFSRRTDFNKLENIADHNTSGSFASAPPPPDFKFVSNFKKTLKMRVHQT